MRKFKHPFLTVAEFIADKVKKNEIISTKKTSVGFCLLFIIDIEKESVVDIIDTDIFLGQIMDDSYYDDDLNLKRNLQLVGYELEGYENNSRYDDSPYTDSLVAVLMQFADYSTRDNHISDLFYTRVIRIKSPTIAEYNYSDLAFDDFLWSNLGIESVHC